MQYLNKRESIIELSDVSFSYNKEEAIKDVSLRIYKGNYVGIIGPNGGGKSTLVKLILKIITPSNGNIKIFGKNVRVFNEWYKIGYVPQKTFMDMNFPVTVQEVVSMGRYGKLGLFHYPSRNDKDKVFNALRHVDMFDYKNRQISDLSSGQQQRVFIARALASEPEIIILDEPTVGVDVKNQKQFYKLLRKLNKELDLTLILVSHELDVVAHESTVLGYINRTMDYFGDPAEFLKGAYFHQLIGLGGLHH
jgi:zinc transport system ATP-binding protein